MPSSVHVPAFAGRYVHALGLNCACCEPAPLRSSARGSECLIGSHMRCTRGRTPVHTRIGDRCKASRARTEYLERRSRRHGIGNTGRRNCHKHQSYRRACKRHPRNIPRSFPDHRPARQFATSIDWTARTRRWRGPSGQRTPLDEGTSSAQPPWACFRSGLPPRPLRWQAPEAVLRIDTTLHHSQGPSCHTAAPFP